MNREEKIEQAGKRIHQILYSKDLDQEWRSSLEEAIYNLISTYESSKIKNWFIRHITLPRNRIIK